MLQTQIFKYLFEDQAVSPPSEADLTTSTPVKRPPEMQVVEVLIPPGGENEFKVVEVRVIPVVALPDGSIHAK